MLDPERDRVIKATHPETYGGAPQIDYGIDESTGRPAQRLVLGKGTPLQYLERWCLFNAVFADDVQLERVLSIGYGLSIVVSQRDIRGRSPSMEAIGEFFVERGFAEPPQSTNAWYRALDGLLAMGAHAANLVETDHGIVPIDIPIFRPDRDTRAWLKRAGIVA